MIYSEKYVADTVRDRAYIAENLQKLRKFLPFDRVTICCKDGSAYVEIGRNADMTLVRYIAGEQTYNDLSVFEWNVKLGTATEVWVIFQKTKGGKA
jgi:hypothetical protein